MGTAYFIVPYKRRADRDLPTRYCAMDDHPGVKWDEIEINDDRAAVKVEGTTRDINALPFEPLKDQAEVDALIAANPRRTPRKVDGEVEFTGERAPMKVWERAG